MIRFGQKKGSYIKTISMLAISTILVIVWANLPYSFVEKILQTIQDIREGKGNETIMLAVSFMPLLCLTAYYASYKFSCKLFMKGVDSYDK